MPGTSQDAPLVYQAFFGGQFTQDGAAAQVGGARPTCSSNSAVKSATATAFPAARATRTASAPGASTCTPAATSARATSWRAGLSYLQTTAVDRASTLTDLPGNIAQIRSLARAVSTIADFVWKYAPNGNASATNFKLQGEYFWRRESGDLTYDSDGALGLTQTDDYSVEPERLLRAGRLAIHADVARRRALRLARPGLASTTARNAAFLATDAVQSAAHDRDVRLDAVGIQPRSPAVRAEQGAARASPTTSSSSNTS